MLGLCAKIGGPQSQRNGPHADKDKTDDRFCDVSCRGLCFYMCALARIPNILPFENYFFGLNFLSYPFV